MSDGEDFDYDSRIRSWELQQNAHIKNREARFEFMFEMVEQVCGDKPLILDIACGPGSLSGRFLGRFPEGKSVGVDYDPVLLRFARNTSLYDHSRVEFVEADLASENWTQRLPRSNFNAVMSTTALHWLPQEALRKVYADIFSLLGDGGVFLNGDHIYPDSEPQRLKDLFTESRHSFEDGKFSTGEALNWTDWWKELESHSELRELLKERKTRYPNSDNHSQNIPLEKHVSFLQDAGFHTVGVGWQDLDNRVLVALK